MKEKGSKTTVAYSQAQKMMDFTSEKIFIESVKYGARQKHKDEIRNHVLIYIDRYDCDNADPESINFQLNLCLADAMGKENFKKFSEENHGKNMYVSIKEPDIQTRNANIMKDFASGMTSTEIGEKYDITPAAARKVKERYYKV